MIRTAWLLVFGALTLWGQGPQNVLVVVNRSDALSRRIGQYYVHRRGIPLRNVCTIAPTAQEEISWDEYQRRVEQPVADCLRSRHLEEQVLYIATTRGVPLKVTGGGSGPGSEAASVDSELTLLYAKLKGVKFVRAGMVPNPFFEKRDAPFRHPLFQIYLVTRLAGYDFDDVRGLVDRALAARNRGKFVFDLKSAANEPGNNWLRNAATLLPADRVVVEESDKVLYGEQNVIGYAAWGSNDPNRKQRHLGFQWLPGALVDEFVSSDGRTFERPPDSWNITTWKDKEHFWAGSPQSLSADYIHEGASGCSGHVYEPYLTMCPRPDYLFPAYYAGRNLAESYYMAIPGLSWQNIVVGDPLCALGKP